MKRRSSSNKNFVKKVMGLQTLAEIILNHVISVNVKNMDITNFCLIKPELVYARVCVCAYVNYFRNVTEKAEKILLSRFVAETWLFEVCSCKRYQLVSRSGVKKSLSGRL